LWFSLLSRQQPLQRAEVILRQIEDLSVPVKLELVWRQDNRSAALARLVETVAASEQVMLTKRQQS
jgi:hypothetical protein